MVHTKMEAHVCLKHHVRMAKDGILMCSNVSALKELDGMDNSV